MLINREVFSLPPYISTSWGHVIALFMQEATLVVVLSDGTTIKVPRLSADVVEKIFAAHAGYLEEQSHKEHSSHEGGTIAQILEMPFRLNLSHLEGLTTAMQHNPEQANMPDLPEEMLNKIGAITKLAGLNDPQQLPKAEPHCNCIHCQIARAIHKGVDSDDEIPAEKPKPKPSSVVIEIPETEKWLVEQTDEHVYKVTNSENTEEFYKVYLGAEVGCNCGKHGCEHILAVLRS